MSAAMPHLPVSGSFAPSVAERDIAVRPLRIEGSQLTLSVTQSKQPILAGTVLLMASAFGHWCFAQVEAMETSPDDKAVLHTRVIKGQASLELAYATPVDPDSFIREAYTVKPLVVKLWQKTAIDVQTLQGLTLLEVPEQQAMINGLSAILKGLSSSSRTLVLDTSGWFAQHGLAETNAALHRFGRDVALSAERFGLKEFINWLLEEYPPNSKEAALDILYEALPNIEPCLGPGSLLYVCGDRLPAPLRFHLEQMKRLNLFAEQEDQVFNLEKLLPQENGLSFVDLTALGVGEADWFVAGLHQELTLAANTLRQATLVVIHPELLTQKAVERLALYARSFGLRIIWASSQAKSLSSVLAWDSQISFQPNGHLALSGLVAGGLHLIWPGQAPGLARQKPVKTKTGPLTIQAPETEAADWNGSGPDVEQMMAEAKAIMAGTWFAIDEPFSKKEQQLTNLVSRAEAVATQSSDGELAATAIEALLEDKELSEIAAKPPLSAAAHETLLQHDLAVATNGEMLEPASLPHDQEELYTVSAEAPSFIQRELGYYQEGAAYPEHYSSFQMTEEGSSDLPLEEPHPCLPDSMQHEWQEVTSTDETESTEDIAELAATLNLPSSESAGLTDDLEPYTLEAEPFDSLQEIPLALDYISLEPPEAEMTVPQESLTDERRPETTVRSLPLLDSLTESSSYSMAFPSAALPDEEDALLLGRSLDENEQTLLEAHLSQPLHWDTVLSENDDPSTWLVPPSSQEPVSDLAFSPVSDSLKPPQQKESFSTVAPPPPISATGQWTELEQDNYPAQPGEDFADNNDALVAFEEDLKEGARPSLVIGSAMAQSDWEQLEQVARLQSPTAFPEERLSSEASVSAPKLVFDFDWPDEEQEEGSAEEGFSTDAGSSASGETSVGLEPETGPGISEIDLLAQEAEARVEETESLSQTHEALPPNDVMPAKPPLQEPAVSLNDANWIDSLNPAAESASLLERFLPEQASALPSAYEASDEAIAPVDDHWDGSESSQVPLIEESSDRTQEIADWEQFSIGGYDEDIAAMAASEDSFESLEADAFPPEIRIYTDPTQEEYQHHEPVAHGVAQTVALQEQNVNNNIAELDMLFNGNQAEEDFYEVPDSADPEAQQIPSQVSGSKPRSQVLANEAFQVGQAVLHEKYGKGWVQKVMTLEGRTILHIDFEGVGKRLLDPDLSPLEPA